MTRVERKLGKLKALSVPLLKQRTNNTFGKKMDMESKYVNTVEKLSITHNGKKEENV